jgi:hypothetical protein
MSLKEMQEYDEKMGYRGKIPPMERTWCNECVFAIPLGMIELGYIAVLWCKEKERRAHRDKKIYCTMFKPKTKSDNHV